MVERIYRLKYLLPVAAMLLLFIAIVVFSTDDPKLTTDSLPPAPSVASVEEIGLVQNPQRPQFVRDGGAGAKVGDKYLWTFGDTLFNPRSVDQSSGRSNTAGYASLTDPLKISEPLDANRAPSQFIPFSSPDKAYNDSTKKGDDRYAIWTGLVVPRPEKKDALIYFLRLKVNPGGSGLNYDLLNAGLARVAEGSTTAEVLVPELFKKPSKLYNGPGFVKDDTIYLYDCPSASLTACSFAKVAVDDAENRSKYLFWDGSSWQPDITKVAEGFPGSSAGTSLGYLPAFKRYVIFYNRPFGKEQLMATSTDLTRGWSKPQRLYVAPERNYALTYHPDLSTEGGKKLFLTYYQPGSGIHAIRVQLN